MSGRRRLLGMIVVLAALGVVSALQAQPSMHRRGELDLRGFGGPVLAYTTVDGEPALMIGGHGAIYASDRVYLGLTGWSSVNRPTVAQPADSPMPERYWGLVSGSLMAGCEFSRSRRWVFGAELSVGAGTIEMKADDPPDWYDEPDPDNFLFGRPSLTVQLAATEWLRVNAGAGYRIVGSITKFGLSNADAGGPVLSAGVRFGRFE
ncbi:MAG: hypothetical protein MAG453_01224 [Calditrichaeota bacterium]|nr:hypothetical protein [Calditrichota bacterium]